MIKFIKYSHLGGKINDCLAHLQEPDNGGVTLKLYSKDNHFSMEKRGDNFFTVLQDIRKTLVKDDIEILCNGTSVNVYPSAMQLGMGSGDRAYFLRMGLHTTMDDLIEVFDYDPICHIRGTLQDQLEYYNRWVISKKKRAIDQPKFSVENIDTTERTYLFFWGHQPGKDESITKSCLSQWWPCKFTKDGITYASTEQWMMAEKARIFGDLETLKKILATENPKEIKSLGRTVSFFEQYTWNLRAFDIVKEGNFLKFTQNPELKKYLLSTNDYVLVEASPYDKIWGIGMSEKDSGIENPSNWKGENLLGFALMEVRDEISKNQL